MTTVAVVDGGVEITVSQGQAGAPGAGVPVGGTTGEVLAKATDADLDTEWVAQTGGTGGAVDSVNGQTGVVVLDAVDVGALTPAAADILYDPAGSATAAVAAHALEADPHPGYLTAAEGDAAYDPLGAAAAAQAASDPAGSAAAAQAASEPAGTVATHAGVTTSVHGIADTSLLLTDVVADLTPQLGGDLDAQGFDMVNVGALAIGDSELSVTIGGVVYETKAVVHHEGNAVSEHLGVHKHSDIDGLGAHLILAKSGGTETAETAVVDGETLGRVSFVGYDGTDYEYAAFIIGQVDGTPANDPTDMPGRIIFATTPDGGSVPVERMRVDRDGNLTGQGGILSGFLLASPPQGELLGDDVIEQLGELDTRLTDQFVTRATTRIQLVEHFFGVGVIDNVIGALGWRNANSGGAGAPGVAHLSGAGHVRQVKTGTAGTGAYGALHLGIASLTGTPVGLFHWDFFLSALSTAGEEFQAWVGLHDGSSAAPTDGIYFEYDRLNHGTTWQAVCAAAGTRTRVDTGVVVGSLFTGAAKLRAVMDGTAAVFYIDGTQVATIATNLPGASNAYGPNAAILKVAGAGDSVIQVDRFVLDIEG